MGAPKALLSFDGETMLQRVVRVLGEVVSPVVVVAAQGQRLPELPAEVIIARDERDFRGPLEGLRVGLLALPETCEAAYATGCDVPLLKAGFVREMIKRLGENDAAVPVEGELHHPLAAVYRRRLTGEIESLLRADRRRADLLFDRVRTLRVPVDELRSCDPRLQSLCNVNTPEDYDAALREGRP